MPETQVTKVRPDTSGSYDARVIDFTDWALEILMKADEAARRFNPDARIRIRRGNGGVAFELVDEMEPSDAIVDTGRLVVVVEAGIEGTVDVVEPHDRLILRAPGDPERSVRGTA